MTISNELLDQLIGNRSTQEDLFGKNGLLKELGKRLMERVLEAEMEHHLGYKKHAIEGNNSGNSRNGKSKKTVKTDSGEIEIEVPRDRNAEFEPKLIPKRQNRLSGLDDLVLALYAKGLTVRDIRSHLEELYGVEISADLISQVTDAVIDDMRNWRNRALEELYPILFIDGFVVKCRLDNKVVNRTVYILFGINLQGHKDVLGLYLGENESSKFWLHVLTEIKNRGVKDIFILCGDGLKGLPEAVEASFPKTTFQTCIVHMIRHSLNYVPYKEKKAVAEDLRKIYSASTLELAELALDDFELNWGEKYPAIIKSWRSNWAKIIPFFDFPPEMRKVIYTTNIIESLNSSLRKAVRNKGHFPTEDAVMKVLYLAINSLSKRWTQPLRNWTLVLNQIAIVYAERMPISIF